MTLYLNGTTGISGVDGSSGTPAVQGTDTNTGISFPAADTIAFNEGGAEVGRFDSSGRLLVGTSTSVTGSSAGLYARLQVVGNTGGNSGIAVVGNALGASSIGSGSNIGTLVFTDNAAGEYASISCQADATGGTNDYPGRLTFSTTADGASSPTERLRIGNAGGIDVSATGNADNYLRNTAGQTTASGANLFIDSSNGVLRRSTSSIKYKTDVETLQDSYADEILKCRPVWYRSKSEYDNQQWGHWGFIAEEVAEVDPRLCFFGKNEDGSLEPEGVQYDRFVPHLLNLIKRQKEQIEALEARLTAAGI